MAAVSEKKRKLLAVARLLLEETDEAHPLTLPQLLQALEDRGISAERKSVYDDLETLRAEGLPIETKKTKTFGYYIGDRLFSREELALLRAGLDRLSLPRQDRDALCEKLERLCSRHQAEQLRSLAALESSPAPEPQPPEKKPGEKPRELTLEYTPAAAEAVARRYGELHPEQAGKNRLRITVTGETGPELFAWLFLCGQDVRLVSPKKLAEQFRDKAKSAAKHYK